MTTLSCAIPGMSQIVAKDISYTDACKKFFLHTLEERRQKLSLKFALRCLKNEKVASLFPLNDAPDYELRKLSKFKIPNAKTQRYKNSPLPYLISLLNQHFSPKM